MRRILGDPSKGGYCPVVLIVFILVGLASPDRVEALTEVELEDDYLVATKEFEQQCIHRCPDQVSSPNGLLKSPQVEPETPKKVIRVISGSSARRSFVRSFVR